MSLEKFSVKDKVLFFTGGGGHIVGALVETFAAQGAICISTDFRSEKLDAQKLTLRDRGLSLDVHTLDVTDESQWKKISEEVFLKYGSVHGLINGAGINSPSTFLEIEVDSFRSILDVNLVGTFLGCQAYGAKMIKQGFGSIVNISSTSADPPLSKAFAYSASKAGVTNLTKNVAREFGKTGVRVNSLRPGFFPTEWNKKNFLSEERIEAILRHTPMGRFGIPDELSGAVQWLLSDASQFVTGSEIVVDGGFSCQTI